MSIAFPTTETGSTLDQIRAQRINRETSAARVEANRRNAQRSTGPRTAEGKRRASRNALKHGLCRTLACLPSECEATFLTFVAELEQELRPATPLQRIAFNQIASLTWRLQRLPEAQVRIFEQELAKVEPIEHDETREDGTVQLKASDVLARRFSDDPASNGFALLERYERGLRSQLLRLMKHYDQLQKHRSTVPYDKDEPPCPPEGKQPAWTEEKARAQREWCAEQERLHAEGKEVDPEWLRIHEIQRKQREDAARATGEVKAPTASRAAGSPLAASRIKVRPSATPQAVEAPPDVPPTNPAKRTQSKPTESPVPAQPAGNCAVSALAPARNEANAVQTVDTLRDVPPQPVPPGSAECDKPPANGYES